MDLKHQILKDYSKKHALELAGYIGSDVSRFDELMQLFLGGTYQITQRSAWVVSFCCDKYPFLITPYLEKMILNLRNDVPDAVKRNTVRVLQNVDLPDELLGEAADVCFHLLSSKTEPVAVKVFSMTVLLNIVKKVPELKNELRIVIEDQIPYGTAGFMSRGKKTLKALEKIQSGPPL